MDPIFGAVQQNLDSALNVPFVSSSVVLGLAFYAYKAAPELPSFLEELFLNVFFRVFVGFMVLYMGTGNFMLSLVVSVVFVYGVGMISGLKEGMFGGFGPGSSPGHSGPSPGEIARKAAEEAARKAAAAEEAARKATAAKKAAEEAARKAAEEAARKAAADKKAAEEKAFKQNRKMWLDDARKSMISDQERNKFNSMLEELNIRNQVKNYFDNNPDLLNPSMYDKNVKNFMCDALFKNLIKVVSYPSDDQDRYTVIKGSMTKKDFEDLEKDLKKIRLARLFKDEIMSSDSFDSSLNIFNRISSGFSRLIYGKLPDTESKRQDIIWKYSNILKNYSDKYISGTTYNYATKTTTLTSDLSCPWMNYDKTIQ